MLVAAKPRATALALAAGGHSRRGSNCGKQLLWAIAGARCSPEPWADTKQSFGWNQKTAIIVLTAVVGLAVTFRGRLVSLAADPASALFGASTRITAPASSD
jgi:hypothetical protein